MLPSNVRNTNLGFTLIEISIGLLVLTLLAAVSIPQIGNFAIMLRRFQTNSTFDEVKNTIKEAQRQAIQLGKTCQIKIDTTAKTINVNNETTDRGCLLNPLNFDALTSPSTNNPTTIKTSSSDGIITFHFQGNTDTLQTIVVSNESRDYNKCLVISNGIGMMRSGEYNGYPSSTPDPDSCKTQQ
jgi:prepilin-type N-terminal cleavage/methylation domain-containing protein